MNDQANSVDERYATTPVTLTGWSRQDTTWMLGLFGTAIGAGTLFLPINAGLGGFWPLLILALLAFPMTYYAHRGLTRFVLSGRAGSDITEVVEEHFGIKAGALITLLYFFAIFPILLIYSVALTNTVGSFMSHQLHIEPPPRALLSFVLILGLLAVVRCGEQVIVKAMSLMVYPFIVALLFLAVYLVPHWNGGILSTASTVPAPSALLHTLWLAIPVMVFSFNHSPIISAFAVVRVFVLLDLARALGAGNFYRAAWCFNFRFRIQQYKNPHNGEVIETKGGNHKTLKHCHQRYNICSKSGKKRNRLRRNTTPDMCKNTPLSTGLPPPPIFAHIEPSKYAALGVFLGSRGDYRPTTVFAYFSVCGAGIGTGSAVAVLSFLRFYVIF